MFKQQTTHPDYIAWAKHVNERWIVHAGLRESTQAYLQHLSETDTPRLYESCRIAFDLVEKGRPDVDPKPRFYSGLFCHSNLQEIQRFLQHHEMTCWLIGFSCVSPVPPSAELIALKTEVQEIQHPKLLKEA